MYKEIHLIFLFDITDPRMKTAFRVKYHSRQLYLLKKDCTKSSVQIREQIMYIHLFTANNLKTMISCLRKNITHDLELLLCHLCVNH